VNAGKHAWGSRPRLPVRAPARTVIPSNWPQLSLAIALDRVARSRGMVRFSVTWYLVQVPHICLLLADVGFAIVGPSDARTVIPSGAREPYLFHLILKAAQLGCPTLRFFCAEWDSTGSKSTPARPSSTPTHTRRSGSSGTPASLPVRTGRASCTALPTGTGRSSPHRTPRTKSQ
jgi:hypothetical protein